MTFIRSFLIGAVAAGAMTSAAQAADLLTVNTGPTPFYQDKYFMFEGFYAGVTGGGVVGGGGLSGSVGGVAGVNFAVSDMFYVGAEAQASGWFNGGGFSGYDALGLAHLGVLLSDNMMIYAAGGGGLVSNAPVYALGAGLEVGLGDTIGLRAEGLALAPWGAMPAAGKVQAGLIFHFN